MLNSVEAKFSSSHKIMFSPSIGAILLCSMLCSLYRCSYGVIFNFLFFNEHYIVRLCRNRHIQIYVYLLLHPVDSLNTLVHILCALHLIAKLISELYDKRSTRNSGFPYVAFSNFWVCRFRHTFHSPINEKYAIKEIAKLHV